MQGAPVGNFFPAMRITPKQMTMLAAPRRDEFLRRLRVFIEEQTKRVPAEETLAALFERGMTYGLVTEQQFAGYILLAWAAKAGGGTPDPAWIGDVMKDPYRTPDDKVAAIFERANRNAQARA